MKPILNYTYLNSIPYKKALQLQEYYSKNHTKNLLLLLQHPPTYTVGRRVRDVDPNEINRLTKLGAEYHQVPLQSAFY
jgi:lipoyl(octanoyl) transferase